MLSLASIATYTLLTVVSSRAAHPITFVFVLAVVGGLIALSRRGYPTVSAWLLIGFMFVAVFYTNVTRGVDLPMTWMFYTLIVYMTGILIGPRASFGVTFFIAFAFTSLTWWHQAGYNPYFIEDWRTDGFKIQEAVGFCFSLWIIYVVTWLSKREINRSLNRARASEAALKVERDSLEVKVEQRTRELREEQQRRLEEHARFADFGRLASGVLHDLANPLTSMSLNLQQARASETGSQGQLLERVIQGAERMGALLRTARTQFRPSNELVTFSLADEIEHVAELLSFKARNANVIIDLNAVENVQTLGSPQAFNRVVANLMANAIDAYADTSLEHRPLRVTCTVEGDDAVITVEDEAGGIKAELQTKIFEPFFTTKAASGGSGMGLVSAKSIAETDFGGSLILARSDATGSAFEFRFPIRLAEDL
jgi:signal transduction histidine kinase